MRKLIFESSVEIFKIIHEKNKYVESKKIHLKKVIDNLFIFKKIQVRNKKGIYIFQLT